MNITKIGARCLALVSVTLAGCASTQGASFRGMTAAEHERMAAAGGDAVSPEEHRNAAAGLRERERAACIDVPDADRDRGPFARLDRIVRTVELRERLFPKAPLQTVGVEIEIRATPALTEQWLGRLIQCHLAHYAVVGAAAADPKDPLTTDGAHVSVASTQTGFRVAITSPASEVARELVRKGVGLSENGS